MCDLSTGYRKVRLQEGEAVKCHIGNEKYFQSRLAQRAHRNAPLELLFK
jgi:hypothetical protein